MKNWKEKLLRRYLGERDEYEKSKIYEILADNNMLTFYLISLAMMISFVWDTIHQQFSLGTFLLFAIQQFNSYYIVLKMRKYRLLKTEFYDKKSFDAALKDMKRKSFWGGLDWGFFMFITNSYILPSLWGGHH